MRGTHRPERRFDRVLKDEDQPHASPSDRKGKDKEYPYRANRRFLNAITHTVTPSFAPGVTEADRIGLAGNSVAHSCRRLAGQPRLRRDRSIRRGNAMSAPAIGEASGRISSAGTARNDAGQGTAVPIDLSKVTTASANRSGTVRKGVCGVPEDEVALAASATDGNL